MKRDQLISYMVSDNISQTLSFEVHAKQFQSLSFGICARFEIQQSSLSDCSVINMSENGSFLIQNERPTVRIAHLGYDDSKKESVQLSTASSVSKKHVSD